MIKRKLKDCLDCRKKSIIWSKGKCKACFHLDKDYRIPKVSAKQKAALDKYSVVRKEYLSEHPKCEANLEGCTKAATDIHHCSGRVGKLLTDKSNFKALCRSCHQWCETNPVEAKKLGLSKNRL